MKQHNTGKKTGKQQTIGIDVGDKTSRYCMLDTHGKVVKESSVGSTKKAKGGRKDVSDASRWSAHKYPAPLYEKSVDIAGLLMEAATVSDR